MNNPTTANYAEMKEEAERLSRMLKRDVEVAPANCDCDYWPFCEKCGGSRLYYQLVYGFCNHTVQDGNDSECEAADCVHREYLAFCQREEEREAVTR